MSVRTSLQSGHDPVFSRRMFEAKTVDVLQLNALHIALINAALVTRFIFPRQRKLDASRKTATGFGERETHPIKHRDSSVALGDSEARLQEQRPSQIARPPRIG